MRTQPSSDQRASIIRIAEMLLSNPASFPVLGTPDPAHLLRDLIDSLLLEGDPGHAEDIISLLYALSGDMRFQELVASLVLEGNLDRPEAIGVLLHAVFDERHVADGPPSTASGTPPDNASRVLSNGGRIPLLRETLTTRERDVLRLLGTGISNHEIAHKLTVTVNTVKTHLGSIYSKLRVHNRVQATVRARELGLL